MRCMKTHKEMTNSFCNLRPSDPHVGRLTLQHDSRHIRVLWQCLRFVRTTPWPQVSNFISHVELYTFPSEPHTGPSFGALLQSTGQDSRIADVLPHGPTWANDTATEPTRHACTRSIQLNSRVSLANDYVFLRKFVFTDLSTFDRLYRTHDLYRLDNGAYKQIPWHVHIHLVIPKSTHRNEWLTDFRLILILKLAQLEIERSYLLSLCISLVLQVKPFFVFSVKQHQVPFDIDSDNLLCDNFTKHKEF